MFAVCADFGVNLQAAEIFRPAFTDAYPDIGAL
jgi:hypothetical protein